MKCTIHSEHGSIMVIPREDNMVRLYIQIASSTDKDWNPRKSATEKEVQDSAKRILQPYDIEWERVEWYSVYPIGQGIADKYSLDNRVFMGGDACHTHSVSSFPLPTISLLTGILAKSRPGYEYGIS
jgi:2-polyprenyl-6-methoxyphenol hydroxylase-like FAD-dependent oxidoreductase